jgi:hypothetical protein
MHVWDSAQFATLAGSDALVFYHGRLPETYATRSAKLLNLNRGVWGLSASRRKETGTPKYLGQFSARWHYQPIKPGLPERAPSISDCERAFSPSFKYVLWTATLLLEYLPLPMSSRRD